MSLSDIHHTYVEKAGGMAPALLIISSTRLLNDTSIQCIGDTIQAYAIKKDTF
jgi:hypothetical protein